MLQVLFSFFNYLIVLGAKAPRKQHRKLFGILQRSTGECLHTCPKLGQHKFLRTNAGQTDRIRKQERGKERYYPVACGQTHLDAFGFKMFLAAIAYDFNSNHTQGGIETPATVHQKNSSHIPLVVEFDLHQATVQVHEIPGRSMLPGPVQQRTVRAIFQLLPPLKLRCPRAW